MQKWSIFRKPRKRRGLATHLYYVWKSVRYRPLLGYDLTMEEEERLAVAMIQWIQAQADKAHKTEDTATLKDILPLFWQSFERKRRVDNVRPRGIIENHLLPFFGDRVLSTISHSEGHDYVGRRMQAGASAGTIRREYQVLMRLLNLAVLHDMLDKNRLKKVDLPEATKRTRTAQWDELQAIRAVRGDATAELWRVITVAANTGLRETKLLQIRRSWIRKKADGYWLTLPPARTRIKGNPTEIPLNRWAVAAALGEDVPSLTDDRIFRRWHNVRSFKKYWASVLRRARVVDLHFHDLRHTYATWLQDLGADYEVRQTLLGHRMPGMTANYSHGGSGWNQKLRAAVEMLENNYNFGDQRLPVDEGICASRTSEASVSASVLHYRLASVTAPVIVST
jgi:integrase